MSAAYLFVYDTRDGTFPERYRVLKAGEDESLADAEPVTGAIRAAKRQQCFERLRARYPEPHFEVEIQTATRWETVARSYGGMRHEHFQ